MSAADVGVIGGSGLYALASQQSFEEVVLETPWGAPSGPYRIGMVSGHRVAFLARHGAGHRYLPSEVPYRANVWGFRQLGVTRLISASAVGSLREELAPRQFVIVERYELIQFFADNSHTLQRPRTPIGCEVLTVYKLVSPHCGSVWTTPK